MVDTGVTKVVKVGTPLLSFVMNIAGLAFLVITWQQLLGDSASTLQTTLTLVGAAMSLAIIVALYVSRKTQVEKFQADMDDGKKWMPTEEEAAAQEAADEAAEAGEVDPSVEEEESINDVEEDATEFEDDEEEESTAIDDADDTESESDEVVADEFEEAADEPDANSFEEEPED